MDSSVSSWSRGAKEGETSILAVGVVDSGSMGLPVLGSLKSGENLIDMRGVMGDEVGRGVSSNCSMGASGGGVSSWGSFFFLLSSSLFGLLPARHARPACFRGTPSGAGYANGSFRMMTGMSKPTLLFGRWRSTSHPFTNRSFRLGKSTLHSLSSKKSLPRIA